MSQKVLKKSIVTVLPALVAASFLLVAASLAALVAVVSCGCGTALTFEVGKGSSPNSLSLVSNVAIAEVEVRQKGSNEWSELKESPANTWTLESTTPLNGPFSVRFDAKSGGHRVVDDVIPADFKAGSVYKTSLQF